MPVPADGALLPRPVDPDHRPLGSLLDLQPALAVAGQLAGPDVRAVSVSGCTLDSRQVQVGDLYAALPGAHVHGARFTQQAADAGAKAVLTDPAGLAAAAATGLPVLLADAPRGVLGEVARWVYGDPAAALLVLGVTGTNGKTTTAFLLEAGLRAAGYETGLLGTVLTRIGDDVVPSARTTPEAPDLQALLAVMRERGVGALALEVSSHALALGRVDGLVVDVAGFTNLSQDHLDFHPDMAAYEAAKASLFTPAHARRGVVCVDDPAGARIATGAAVPVVRVGPGERWRADDVCLSAGGSTFRVRGPGVDLPAEVRLPGSFNVTNALLAVAMLAEAGVDPVIAVRGIAELAGVPGRMERVDAGTGVLGIVDYAHTPEAVRRLVEAARDLTGGRVLIVLGCGGDRDRGKRPLMGQAAVSADVAVLTSDNPRSEEPEAILAEMAAGAPGVAREPDRRAAIATAVAQARPGDVVLVAGKGHESGQEAGGVVTAFDDRLVLREELLAGARA